MKKRKRYVAAMWKSYEEKCVPAGAEDDQRVQTQVAFYSGAWGLLQMLVGGLDEGTQDATEADVQMVDDINAELEEFVDTTVAFSTLNKEPT